MKNYRVTNGREYAGEIVTFTNRYKNGFAVCHTNTGKIIHILNTDLIKIRC